MTKYFNDKRYLIAAAAFVYLGYLALLVGFRYNGNITGMLFLGTGVSSGPCPLKLDESFLVRPDPGYDGQYYFYIALDPLAKTDLHYCTDGGPYRYQRILLPLTARLLSLGNMHAIPYAIVFINLMAILLSTWLLMKFCEKFSVTPFWALLYPFSIGLRISFSRCTVEPYYMFFIICAFFFWIAREKLWLGILFFSLAILTKEAAIFAVAASGGALFLQKGKRLKAFYFAIPFAVYYLWQLYIHHRFGIYSMDIGSAGKAYSWTIPLRGVFEHLRDAPGTKHSIEIGFVLGLILTLVLIFREARRLDNPFVALGVLYAVLFSFYTKFGYSDFGGYPRHSIELFLCLFFLYLYNKKKIYLVPLAVNAVYFFFIN